MTEKDKLRLESKLLINNGMDLLQRVKILSEVIQERVRRVSERRRIDRRKSTTARMHGGTPIRWEFGDEAPPEAEHGSDKG